MSTLPRSPLPPAAELLRTKLMPPRPRAALVACPALHARLDTGFERALTLLLAPAGYGKTTLASAWLTCRVAADDMLVAWVSLDAGDNDPVRFWRYVIAACQSFDPEVGEWALTLLAAPQQRSFDTALIALINDLSQLATRGVLVLEDYHVIAARQIHEALAFLLKHMPPTLHVMLITHDEPPLPLARLRARDELCELSAAELRFSLAETSAFLEHALASPLPSETITQLHEHTKGWAAGLRLAALLLRDYKPQETGQMLPTFTGRHRHVADYFATEVLDAQPAHIQTFLLTTAFLSRLSASLCNAVTGGSDSAAMLHQLDQANLFITPLDDVQQWYTYHPLFAEQCSTRHSDA